MSFLYKLIAENDIFFYWLCLHNIALFKIVMKKEEIRQQMKNLSHQCHREINESGAR